jgi:hypothetical protein
LYAADFPGTVAVAASVTEAVAASSVLFCCLPNVAAGIAVMAEVTAAACAGLIVVDNSTVDPATAAGFASCGPYRAIQPLLSIFVIIHTKYNMRCLNDFKAHTHG